MPVVSGKETAYEIKRLVIYAPQGGKGQCFCSGKRKIVFCGLSAAKERISNV
jgi:hypothetical protein